MRSARAVLVWALSSTFLAGCSVFGYRGNTPEPAYTVIERIGPVEVRRYGERVAADTWVAGDVGHARSTGFQRLAGYIFGRNRGGRKIAMTAPVAQSTAPGQRLAPVSQQAAGSGWCIRFFLPADLTLDTAPVPEDPKVTLVRVPPTDYAVLRFSGDRSESAVDREIDELERRLAESDWPLAGPPVAWFYDPPWTLPFMRRNEVAIPVSGPRSARSDTIR